MKTIIQQHISQVLIILVGLLFATTSGAEIYYIHNDHLATPKVLTDQNQTVVWTADAAPYGDATTTGTVVFNLRFPGQYFDQETGLHYNYYRYYDPTTGRYITSDPIGLDGGLNTYAYVENNSVNFIDPLGLISDKAAVAIAIGRGNVQQLRNLLPGLAPESAAVAEAAILRLESTASQIIANECKASVTRAFPSELLGNTLAQITRLANSGNKAAKTAKKLLNDKRFKK